MTLTATQGIIPALREIPGLDLELGDALGWSTAAFSTGDDRAYRYTLTRTWGYGGPVVWLMLNPSTADADTLDPTLRRCAAFSRAWGHGSMAILNLFAYRATDPDDMLQHPEPVGPLNDTVLRTVAEHAGPETPWVAGWGAHGKHLGRGDHVRKLLADVDLRCLSVTKAGEPGHPLYLPGILQSQPLPPPGR